MLRPADAEDGTTEVCFTKPDEASTRNFTAIVAASVVRRMGVMM